MIHNISDLMEKLGQYNNGVLASYFVSLVLLKLQIELSGSLSHEARDVFLSALVTEGLV